MLKIETFVEVPERVPVANEDLVEYRQEVGGVHGNILHQPTKLLHYLPHTENTLNVVREGTIEL
jgi:hypothetical protein